MTNFGMKPDTTIEGLGDRFGSEPTPDKNVIYLGVMRYPETGNLGFWVSRPFYWLAFSERSIVVSGDDIEYRCFQSEGSPDYHVTRDECAWLCVQHHEGNYRMVVLKKTDVVG